VRSGFEEMKAARGKKEDAMQRRASRSSTSWWPRNFSTRREIDGHGVRESEGGVRRQGPQEPGERGEPDQHFECDDVLVRSARKIPSRGSSATSVSNSTSGVWRCVDKITFQSSLRKCFSAATPPSARRTSSGPWPTATKLPCRSTACSVAKTSPSAAADGPHDEARNGHPRVELRQRDLQRIRFKVPHKELGIALKNIKVEVELGFDPALAFKERSAASTATWQTVFTASQCIECDACVDICPMDCITFTADGEQADLRSASAPGAPTWRRTSTSKGV